MTLYRKATSSGVTPSLPEDVPFLSLETAIQTSSFKIPKPKAEELLELKQAILSAPFLWRKSLIPFTLYSSLPL